MRYRQLIDSNEFQSKILEIMMSEEKVNKYFNNTTFSTLPNRDLYKQAMIYGMSIASLLTSQCEPVFVVNGRNE